MNNHIVIDKDFMVIGFEEKQSAKGNSYIQLTCSDFEGNLHKIYVPGNFIEQVKFLVPKQDVRLKLDIVYRGKYPKIELLKVL